MQYIYRSISMIIYPSDKEHYTLYLADITGDIKWELWWKNSSIIDKPLKIDDSYLSYIIILRWSHLYLVADMHLPILHLWHNTRYNELGTEFASSVRSTAIYQRSKNWNKLWHSQINKTITNRLYIQLTTKPLVQAYFLLHLFWNVA